MSKRRLRMQLFSPLKKSHFNIKNVKCATKNLPKTMRVWQESPLSESGYYTYGINNSSSFLLHTHVDSIQILKLVPKIYSVFTFNPKPTYITLLHNRWTWALGEHKSVKEADNYIESNPNLKRNTYVRSLTPNQALVPPQRLKVSSNQMLMFSWSTLYEKK